MKNLTKIFMAVAVAMLSFACATDTTEDLGVQVGNGANGENGANGATVELSLSLEESRTQLGEKKDGVYPLYWSEGDQISVNGVASNELTGVGEKATEAAFTVEGISYPWNIVYPAAVGEAVEGSYPVAFPAVQEYVAGNVDPKAVVLYGYATEPTEENPAESIQLQHLTGVLQFNVKGAVTLTGLTVKALSGNIAGSYTVNCATGALTEVEASNTVTMQFGDGLALDAEEATPIYVAVPAGSHGVVRVTLHTANDKMTVKFDSANKPISAGIVREFKELAYAPNNADEDSEVYYINGKDALIQFATDAATFAAPYTKAVVTADIDMTGVEWTPIEGFGAFEFDGGSKTITGLNAPLFGTTSATIKNLTLADVVLNITDNGNSGAFARRIINGSLLYCSATGTSTINCANYDSPETINSYCVYAHGGLVGYVEGSTIDNCTNSVNITVARVYKGTGGNTSRKTAIGGIAGSHANLCSFTNLTNNGAITYTGTTQKSTMYLSGIVGRDVEGDLPNGEEAVLEVAALNNCTNTKTGIITAAKKSKSSKGIILSGITGYLNADNGTVVENLINNGKIEHDATSTTAYVGGIIGNRSNANLKNCSNTAIVQQQSSSTVTAAHVAGIVVESNGSLTDCDNSGNVRVYYVNLAADAYAALGGVVAIQISSKAIVDCDNTASELNVHSTSIIGMTKTETQKDENGENVEVEVEITEGIAAATADHYRIGGIVGYNQGGAAITNCHNGGRVRTRTFYTGAAIGGIVGLNAKSGLVISGCSNSKSVDSNGAIGHTSGVNIHMGGICGKSTQAITIQNCENTETGIVASTSTAEANNATYLMIGGIYGGGADKMAQTISGCTNKGTVSYSGKKTGSAHIGVGGILGYAYSGTTISECENASTAIVGGAGYCALRMGFGGIVGYGYRGDVNIENCTNYGTIQQTATALPAMSNKNRWTAGTGLGGIIGISAQSDNISNCENHGQISIANNNAQGHLYAGGVVGWAMQEQNNSYKAGAPDMTMKNLTNYANLTFTGNALRYYVGGVVGCLTVNEGANARWWNEISGLKNYSNLTVSTTETEGSLYAYGGVIGFAEAIALLADKEYISINSSEFYGDLIADGKANVGAILGCKRNVAVTTADPEDPEGKGFIAENCNIGGNVHKMITYEVEEAGGTVEVTESNKVALDSDTWYRYIYSTAVEQSVAESDGCSYLTENPNNN